MKPRHFMRSGAAVLAALILAGGAAAQSAGGNSLSGGLDLTPELEGGDLFAKSQSSASSSSGRENIAVVRQQGMGNSAEVNQASSSYGAFSIIAQYGTDNIADVTQCGCGNFVDIIQDGSTNLSEITQSGRGNVFVHRQYGDGLSLSVAQYGGAQISVTQTGP